MIFQKTKFSHKFFVKISLIDEELKLNKLSTIYNQLNVEDSSSFDNFLQDYISSLDDCAVESPACDILQPIVNLVLWRRGTKTNSFFRLKLFSSERLLKLTLVKNKYLVPFFFFTPHVLRLKRFINFRSHWNNWNKCYLFTQFFIQSTFHDGEFGLYFNKYNFTLLLKGIVGYVYSYAFRSKMLGRQINFRDRTRRKKIEIL